MKRDADGAVYWDDANVPAGFLGSWHVGGGVWRQRCRDCGLTFDFPLDATCHMRYRGIGPHEVEVHGLQVAGINVGILA